jgi:type I restriction enzyme S subunit
VNLIAISEITPAIRRWKPYPGYKDSGIEWLGTIPEHWEIKRLKFIATVNMGQSPDSADCNVFGEGKPFLQGNGEFGEIHPTPKLYCPTAKKRAFPDDILLSVRAPVGALNVADQEYGIGRGLCAVSPDRVVLSNQYARYVLEVVRLELDSIATGSTYEAVSVDEVKSLLFVQPPVREQERIAEFLDRETAKIDALVAKKERLIELLQEKRAALITRAVTKGLDPNVPMKDSGVEWLGEIPAHWEVRPLHHVLTRITYGFTNPMPVSDEGPFLLTANDIGDGEILYSTARRTTMEAHAKELTDKSRPKSGDILVTKDGTLGRVAVANDTQAWY